MAKKTFYNLDKEKKEIIYEKLREFFQEEDLKNINVSNIVKKLGIARGSFYQYFEDLNDCYYTILSKETGLVHHEFFELWKANNKDLEKTLYNYRDFIIEEFYRKKLIGLYKADIFIFDGFFANHGKNFIKGQITKDEYYLILYIKAIFHQLIKESILTDCNQEEFEKISNKYIYWILKGVNNGSI